MIFKNHTNYNATYEKNIRIVRRQK